MSLRTKLFAGSILLIAASASVHATPFTESIFEDRPAMGAKIAKSKAKMNARSDGQSAWDSMQRSFDGDEERCGNVDIGNINSGGSRGSRDTPRELVVIVQGDVINSNNRCK